METLPVWLFGVGGIPSRQLMTLRAHIGTIADHFISKLPLEAEGPPLGIRSTKVLVEDPFLTILRVGSGRDGRQLRRPVRQGPARICHIRLISQVYSDSIR